MPDLRKTEQEFDNYLSQVGYNRVSVDVGPAPSFQNADYINKTERSIIELKIIDKEHFPEGGLIDSLGALVIKPENINEDGTGMYSFSLPPVNRESHLDNFEEPLRRILKKANRQIRETKQYYFQSPDEAFGCVFLALVGLTSLNPIMVGHLVKKILSAEFSSIDAIIICRPYELLRDPVSGQIHPEAVSFAVRPNEIVQKTCYELGENWSVFRRDGGHPTD
jgi:hypothetical protein